MGPSPAFYAAMVLYGVASLLYLAVFGERRERAAGVARWVLLAAFVLHAGDISWRAVGGMHPGTSVREALGFLSWLIAGAYLLATLRHGLAVVGALVTPIALLLLGAARLSPPGDAPVELTTLGRIHIAMATLGVAIFALATALATVYLIQERGLKHKHFTGPMFRRGVALETLDSLSHKLVLVGFPIFTVSLFLGMVWVSQRASGFNRPEYPLALITWISFGALLFARSTKGWRGRKAALLTIVGFVAAALVLAIYLARRAVG